MTGTEGPPLTDLLPAIIVPRKVETVRPKLDFGQGSREQSQGIAAARRDNVHSIAEYRRRV
jgi:hypothetical protein